MRLGRVTDWIAAAARARGRSVTPPACAAPPPTGPPLDHERVARVGEVLQSCYPESDEALDDALTTLMLRLTVEPLDPPAPRKR